MGKDKADGPSYPIGEHARMLALVDLLDSLTIQEDNTQQNAWKPDYEESEPADYDLAFAEIGEELLSLTP